MTLVAAWFFAEAVRAIFDIWNYIDRLLANLPFIVLFLMLVYVLKMYFTQLECYSKNSSSNLSNEIDGDMGIDNIHGIFNKREKDFAKKSYKLLSLVVVIVIVALLFYTLLM